VSRQPTVPPILASLDHVKGILNKNIWTGVLRKVDFCLKNEHEINCIQCKIIEPPAGYNVLLTYIIAWLVTALWMHIFFLDQISGIMLATGYRIII